MSRHNLEGCQICITCERGYGVPPRLFVAPVLALNNEKKTAFYLGMSSRAEDLRNDDGNMFLERKRARIELDFEVGSYLFIGQKCKESKKDVHVSQVEKMRHAYLPQ